MGQLPSQTSDNVGLSAAADTTALGMFRSLPQTMSMLRALPESFRTGVGHDYDSHGDDGLVGLEASFEPWMRAHLVPDVLPEAVSGWVSVLTG